MKHSARMVAVKNAKLKLVQVIYLQKIIYLVTVIIKKFEMKFYLIQVHKSLSEALIFASTNPKYDNRLFIELCVQYMKIGSSEHVVYTNCFLF